MMNIVQAELAHTSAKPNVDNEKIDENKNIKRENPVLRTEPTQKM